MSRTVRLILSFKRQNFFYKIESIALFLFLGFIDFIVMPTLTVLGDVLDGLFTCLDIPASRNHHANNIPENATSDHKRNTMYRPWTDILIENRLKWQAKHDAGKRGHSNNT